MGYADRLSVAPGENVAFMVSSEPQKYRAEIVQLIHGDTNPRGSGFKAREVMTSVSGEYIQASTSRCVQGELPPVSWTPDTLCKRCLPWPSQRCRIDRSGTRRISQLSREFGVSEWSITRWVKQADRDAGRGDGGLTTAEREELVRLRRENRQLKVEREILAKATTWFATQETTRDPKRSSDS